MANLRADNLTGTGGRNAIDGSVFFNGSMSSAISDPQDYLALADSDDFFLSGDFSMEAWVYLSKAPAANNYAAIATQWESGGGSDRSVMLFAYHYNNDFYFKADLQTSAGNFSVSGPDLTENGLIQTWHHLAWERNSNTLTLYLNGVSVGTATASGTTNNSTVKFMVGAEDNGSGFGIYGWNGYISNFRICNGHAVYKANFTPPTQKLGLHSETVLLCCQDSDNPLQEATGKTITGYGNLNRTASELTAGELTSSNYSSAESDWSFSNGVATVSMSSGGYESLGSITNPLVNGQLYELVVNVTTFNAGKITFGQANAGNADFTIALGRNVFRHVYSGTTQNTGGIAIYARDATGGGYAINVLSLKQVISGEPPKFLPPYGIDEGVVFDGYVKHNSPNYMYFPTGDTSQRGRGTALFGGGYVTPAATADIEYLSIPSGGITTKWGNLSTTQLSAGQSLSSKTRQLIGGGWASPINNNTINYITIATSGNSLNFGDLVVGRRGSSSVSNDTRGIFGGGYISPADAGTPTMDYVTIATTGDAADFGDLSGNAKGGTATGSTTRAVFALGNVAPVDVNTLEYITIATLSGSTNFGDLPSGSFGRYNGSCSSNTRGIFAGGHYPTEVNTINYITIATTGDATDFGDLFLARSFPSGTSNGIRGVFMGGTENPARQDTIDSVIIATTGNAVNWGDMRVASQAQNGAASDSHGGLS